MKLKCILLLYCLFSLSGNLMAQHYVDTTTSPDFYDLSLEQLMNLEVSIASKQALTTRESPGIITLITEEELAASGARNLMDVLKLVPGFTFCVDVEGVVGLAVRGNWAHEGKALLLIDGLEMNENLYSSLQFGNHYPVDNIKRIEIIRGPGSAMYGGNAEYAVINIITKSGEDLNGGTCNVGYGQTGTVGGQYTASLAFGDKYKGFGYSASVFTGKAIRSDRDYHDFWDGEYDMEDNSDLSTTHINVGMEYKKFQFRSIIDKYTIESKDNYDLVTKNTYPVQFDTYIGDLKKDVSLSSKLVITPRVNVKMQLPWRYNGEVYNNEVKIFDTRTSRYTTGINTTWNPTSRLNLMSGVEYFYDLAQQLGETMFVSTNDESLDYSNTSVFAQATTTTKFVDITGGARYNYNNRFSASFVPRLSLIKAFEKVHYKLLYSEAYKAPNTENIDLNSEIAPERTTVIEFEAGFKMTHCMYVTGNLYDITTKDPIIYFYNNSNDNDGYMNASQTGTRGVEVDIRWKCCNGYIDFTYGYYTAKGKNKLTSNAVPGNDEALLGNPNHEVTLSTSFKFGKHYSLNPTLYCMGKRYGVIGVNAIDEPVIGKYDPVVLANLTLKMNEIFMKGLSASLCMYNLLDQEESYIQPYKGGHAPLPGPSREIRINVAYKFNKK